MLSKKVKEHVKTAVMFAMVIALVLAVMIAFYFRFFNPDTEITVCVEGEGAVYVLSYERINSNSCESVWVYNDIQITLKAYPNLGHTFVGFDIDGVLFTEIEIVGIVTDDMIITAYFE